MISEADLTDYAYIVSARFDAINTHYIKLMARQIKEIGKLSPSNLFRLQQMSKMQQNIDSIEYMLAQETGKTLDELDKVLELSGLSVYKDAYELYVAHNRIQVPFKQNQNMINYIRSVQSLTHNTFMNISNTTVIFESYRNLVDVAIDAVSNGIDSYNNIIRKQLTDSTLQSNLRYADEGLKVTYASGITRRLDSAVRMNVLEGVRQVNNGIREKTGEEFGADGVEVSAHALCARDHIDIQGKQFSKKEFELRNEELRRHISTCNCKHYTFPIILGISKPTYTDKELKQYKANSEKPVNINGKEMTKYQATQAQRNMETAIRKQKDKYIFADTMGDTEMAEKIKNNINQLQSQYNSISQQAGLSPKMDRTYVPGYTGKQVKPKSIKLSI
nr:MAG TPA: minor capsid protein [Caudoviricetes sp.]